jgi:hypothetical protein
VHSRAYHAAYRAAKDAGVPLPEAKQHAQVEAAKAILHAFVTVFPFYGFLRADAQVQSYLFFVVLFIYPGQLFICWAYIRVFIFLPARPQCNGIRRISR